MTDLFMRTTDKGGKAHGGFQWPMEVGATVTAPDWRPDTECGGGLHGLKDGLGDGGLLSWADDAVWWIVSADNAIDLGGKHKFQTCTVVAFGDRHTVTQALYALRPGAIHGLSATAGYGGTATAGKYGTATAGDRGTATAGYGGTATAGDRGAATAGDRGTATAGDGGTLIFLRWIDGRRRVLAAYIGENGVLPHVPYRANADHTAVERADQ